MVKRTKKTFADIFRAELIKFPTIKEDTNTHVHSKKQLVLAAHQVIKGVSTVPSLPYLEYSGLI